MPLPALTGLAHIVPKAIHISLKGSKDKERVARAQADLALAFGGDQEAAARIGQLRETSATAVGKAAYQAAWDQLVAAGKIKPTDLGGSAGPSTSKEDVPVPQLAFGGLQFSTTQIVVIGGVVLLLLFGGLAFLRRR